MGIFRRRKQLPQQPPPDLPYPPPPPTLAPGDLVAARQVVRAFLAGLGDDDRMCTAGTAVVQAGGGVADLDQLMRNARLIHQTGDLGIDRPWRWLAVVTAEARQLGDLALVADIAHFVHLWDTRLRSRMASGELTMALQTPPQDAVREIYAIAVAALAEVDPDHVVADGTGGITVAALRTGIAHRVLDADPPYPAEVSAEARRIVPT
ncbi:hypothetical protein JMF97_17080 [Micromonospora fiedleri]|uniref:Uncharacterized protein n=1 Tax=Micromonospora fiedleri TaxID=1157498 RepID=A0ABS1USJ1_9ACTN|nr:MULTISPECIES: hypothetical protein [Micromonospora]MBL6277870.1 hypothetical protein [Micromonospora fiedleri]WSK40988.1 hypothetical protein OG712_21020 [Micromonospora maris]